MISKTAQIGYKEHGGQIIIDPTANVLDYSIIRSCTGTIKIGPSSSVGYFCIMHGFGNITIGAHVLLSPRVQIYAQNHGIKKSHLIAAQAQSHKGVVIEDDVWVGAGAIITDGVKLGKGCVVGAGSVVTKSVPPYEIWAGNPAKKIGERQ